MPWPARSYTWEPSRDLEEAYRGPTRSSGLSMALVWAFTAHLPHNADSSAPCHGRCDVARVTGGRRSGEPLLTIWRQGGHWRSVQQASRSVRVGCGGLMRCRCCTLLLHSAPPLPRAAAPTSPAPRCELLAGGSKKVVCAGRRSALVHLEAISGNPVAALWCCT